MTRKKWIIGALVCAIMVAAAFVVAAIGDSNGSTTPPPPGGGGSCQLTKVIKTEVKSWGFDLNDVSIGKIDPTLPGATSNRGGAFSDKPLLSESALREFLASNDKAAVEARMLLGNMDNVTWTPVQFLVPTHYEGMKIFVNGKAASGGSVTVPKGDVVWVGTRDCKVVLLVRGPCGNFVPQHPTPVCTPASGSGGSGGCGGCVSNCSPSNCHTTETCTPPPGCKPTPGHPCHPPKKCPCITPTHATQPVPTPPPGPSGAPTKAPSQNPTVPANTSNPAPPTPGGYNGGSTQQPGQSGSPDRVVPSSDPTNTGDPGGF